MLRDYQVDAVNDCIKWLDDYEGPGIAILPTAAGKSYVIAALANHYGKVLVLQPSKELLEQNFSKYQLYNDNAKIFSASMGKKEIGEVTFATLGSIVGLPHLFTNVEVIICDEAHLYPTENSMFSRFKKNLRNAKILGLTATPFRMERMIMGTKLKMLASRNYDWYGYAHVMEIADVRKWWSSVNYDIIDVNEDDLEVNSTGSEYTEDSVIEFAKTTSELIRESVEKYRGRQMLVFVPSIDQAENFAKEYNGVAVSAKTKKNYRKEIIDGFKSMDINIVFNVDVLGVGFDHPKLPVLLDANPTLSLARYYQRYGRLTRPAEGVEKTYVDLCGNTGRFGRVEDIQFKKVGKSMKTLQCFNGDTQVTDVYLHLLHKPKEIIMPFGKYQGESLSSIPTDYLQWCANKVTNNKQIILHINRELANRW